MVPCNSSLPRKNFMRLAIFLLRHIRGVVVLATLISIISGICSTFLIAIINTRVNTAGTVKLATLAYFIGLVCTMLASNFIAEVLLNRVSEDTYYDLRVHLSKQILATSLRKLEEVGAHRLQVALTGDIPNIIGALLR